MSAPANTTLLEVVNTVAQSVGHPGSTDVAASTDESIKRMVFYANLACQQLAQEDWETLNKTATITIAASPPGVNEQGFDLPADFARMLPDTAWDKSTQLPAIGPVNPQDWQWMVVREAMITTRFLWRYRQGKLFIKSPPTTPTPFTFEYQNKNWAVSGSTGNPQDYLQQNSDYHIFPWPLPILLTRAKWLDNEGFDATKAYADYDQQLASAIGSDEGATALSLVPGVGYPYLNAMRNAPDTGYGS